jgi:hypothetical protein
MGKSQDGQGGVLQPHCLFSLAMTTDNDPKYLLLRIIHEWQRRGGVLLKVKEIRSFDSNTILALYNILQLLPRSISCKSCVLF